jgi:hypothetical protein
MPVQPLFFLHVQSMLSVKSVWVYKNYIINVR